MNRSRGRVGVVDVVGDFATPAAGGFGQLVDPGDLHEWLVV